MVDKYIQCELNPETEVLNYKTVSCPENEIYNQELMSCATQADINLFQSEIRTLRRRVKKFLCSGKGLYPDPDNCRNYYACDSNSPLSIGVLFECPKGLFFNAWEKQCMAYLEPHCVDQLNFEYNLKLVEGLAYYERVNEIKARGRRVLSGRRFATNFDSLVNDLTKRQRWHDQSLREKLDMIFSRDEKKNATNLYPLLVSFHDKNNTPGSSDSDTLEQTIDFVYQINAILNPSKKKTFETSITILFDSKHKVQTTESVIKSLQKFFGEILNHQKDENDKVLKYLTLNFEEYLNDLNEKGSKAIKNITSAAHLDEHAKERITVHWNTLRIKMKLLKKDIVTKFKNTTDNIINSIENGAKNLENKIKLILGNTTESNLHSKVIDLTNSVSKFLKQITKVRDLVANAMGAEFVFYEKANVLLNVANQKINLVISEYTKYDASSTESGSMALMYHFTSILNHGVTYPFSTNITLTYDFDKNQYSSKIVLDELNLFFDKIFDIMKRENEKIVENSILDVRNTIESLTKFEEEILKNISIHNYLKPANIDEIKNILNTSKAKIKKNHTALEKKFKTDLEQIITDMNKFKEDLMNNIHLFLNRNTEVNFKTTSSYISISVTNSLSKISKARFKALNKIMKIAGRFIKSVKEELFDMSSDINYILIESTTGINLNVEQKSDINLSYDFNSFLNSSKIHSFSIKLTIVYNTNKKQYSVETFLNNLDDFLNNIIANLRLEILGLVKYYKTEIGIVTAKALAYTDKALKNIESNHMDKDLMKLIVKILDNYKLAVNKNQLQIHFDYSKQEIETLKKIIALKNILNNKIAKVLNNPDKHDIEDITKFIIDSVKSFFSEITKEKNSFEKHAVNLNSHFKNNIVFLQAITENKIHYIVVKNTNIISEITESDVLIFNYIFKKITNYSDEFVFATNISIVRDNKNRSEIDVMDDLNTFLLNTTDSIYNESKKLEKYLKVRNIYDLKVFLSKKKVLLIVKRSHHGDFEKKTRNKIKNFLTKAEKNLKKYRKEVKSKFKIAMILQMEILDSFRIDLLKNLTGHLKNSNAHSSLDVNKNYIYKKMDDFMVRVSEERHSIMNKFLNYMRDFHNEINLYIRNVEYEIKVLKLDEKKKPKSRFTETSVITFKYDFNTFSDFNKYNNLFTVSFTIKYDSKINEYFIKPISGTLQKFINDIAHRMKIEYSEVLKHYLSQLSSLVTRTDIYLNDTVKYIDGLHFLDPQSRNEIFKIIETMKTLKDRYEKQTKNNFKLIVLNTEKKINELQTNTLSKIVSALNKPFKNTLEYLKNSIYQYVSNYIKEMSNSRLELINSTLNEKNYFEQVISNIMMKGNDEINSLINFNKNQVMNNNTDMTIILQYNFNSVSDAFLKDTLMTNMTISYDLQSKTFNVLPVVYSLECFLRQVFSQLRKENFLITRHYDNETRLYAHKVNLFESRNVKYLNSLTNLDQYTKNRIIGEIKTLKKQMRSFNVTDRFESAVNKIEKNIDTEIFNLLTNIKTELENPNESVLRNASEHINRSVMKFLNALSHERTALAEIITRIIIEYDKYIERNIYGAEMEINGLINDRPLGDSLEYLEVNKRHYLEHEVKSALGLESKLRSSSENEGEEKENDEEEENEGGEKETEGVNEKEKDTEKEGEKETEKENEDEDEDENENVSNDETVTEPTNNSTEINSHSLVTRYDPEGYKVSHNNFSFKKKKKKSFSTLNFASNPF